MDDPITISSALTSMGSVVTSAMGIITNNAIMFCMFAGGLLVVGFKVIKRAKRAAR